VTSLTGETGQATATSAAGTVELRGAAVRMGTRTLWSGLDLEVGRGEFLAGLGLGVFLLGYYHGYASEALNILFGDIFGISSGQILLLGVIAVAVALALVLMWRPLLFASVDPDVARARGVRTGLLGIVFLFVLAITVTEAAQIVGTLLVLSLAITPAAAAQRLSASPGVVTVLSVAMAVVAADGGLLLSFQFPTVKPSVLIVAVSFAFYVAARVAGPALSRRRRGRGGRVTELAELQHG